MAQWGSNDRTSNSVLWGVTGYNKRANTVNRDAFYENVTPDTYLNNGVAMPITVGQFGVDTTEMNTVNGPVNQVVITSVGSGYQNSPASAVISGGGGSGANVDFTNVRGRVTTYTINNGGSSYETAPTITIATPKLNVFNGNTGISAGGILFTAANSHWVAGDRLTYAGNNTSTPVGLTNNTKYYIQAVNTTVITLSATAGGPALTLTGAPHASSGAGGATIQGDAATATAVVGGALHHGVSHAGWVVRKVGEGGRAGRVQYETLVAMGSMTLDGEDNNYFPNANT